MDIIKLHCISHICMKFYSVLKVISDTILLMFSMPKLYQYSNKYVVDYPNIKIPESWKDDSVDTVLK